MADSLPRGDTVPNWQGAKPVTDDTINGKLVRLEAMNKKHFASLYDCFKEAPEHDWYYMPIGAFESVQDFDDCFAPMLLQGDPKFFTIFGQENSQVLGFLSYLNIVPQGGSIEIGYIQFSPKLQRSTAATETIWLLIKHAFDLGYRRVEWKCNSLNARSRKAALRFGFRFEGIFRQATIVKGFNRDTAWYSIIDKEWLELGKIYDKWFEAIEEGSYTSLSGLVNAREGD